MIINNTATLGFFLLIFMHSSLGIIWEDEDTVIVEAEQEIGTSEGIRQKRQFPGFPANWPGGSWPSGIFGGGIFGQKPGAVNPSFPAMSGQCFTTNGEEGTCKTMRQCYPILYYSADETDEKAVRNPPLHSLYQAAATPCRSPVMNHLYFSADASARQSAVCCPNKKKPWVPPTGIKRTTTMRPTTPMRTTSAWWPSRPGPIMGGPGGHRPPTPKPTTTTTTTTTPKPPRQQVSTTTTPRPVQGWPRPPEMVTPATTTKAPYKESSCGRPNIIGGTEASPGMYPWLVSMVVDRKHVCGGSLIDSRHVLTAAHCVAHMGPADVAKIIVLLGDHDLSTVQETSHEVRRVKNIARHRSYNAQTFHNDIALLVLSQDVPFTSNIRPICITQGQTQYDTGSVQGTVAGWGSTQYQTAPVSILRHVTMRIWTNQECTARYGHLAKGGIVNTQVCAASPGKDSCRGDSGGPLMINTNGIYEQVGLVSWGIECGTYPGVYTRVDKYKDWITRNRNR